MIPAPGAMRVTIAASAHSASIAENAAITTNYAHDAAIARIVASAYIVRIATKPANGHATIATNASHVAIAGFVRHARKPTIWTCRGANSAAIVRHPAIAPFSRIAQIPWIICVF